MNTKKITLLAGGIILSLSSFGQKVNETTAAVEFKKVQMAMMTGKMDEAKSTLLNAKKYIELAAEHPETKSSPKTMYYKGEIYGAAMQLAMATGDTNFMINNFGKDAFEVSVNSLKQSYIADKKFRPDIEESVNRQVAMIAPMAGKMYEDKKFEEAAAIYYYVYKVQTAKNVKDSSNLYNAGLCFEKAEKLDKAAEVYAELSEVGYKKGEAFAYAASAYSRLGDNDKALEFLNKGIAKYPGDRQILMELVRVHLAKGDNNAAESALNEAIAADPNNKQLHLIIGTIYTELGKNEDAEKAMLKALELDPNYSEAQYNLGAHYVTWATELRNKANDMNPNDFNYDLTLEKSQELYKKALDPLEKYITKNPKEKSVLLILFQINQNIGNSEKALEYKKRYDAL